MKRVYPQPDWPDSWRMSYPYDLEEIYGESTHLGYSYAYENRRTVALDFLAEVLPPTLDIKVLDIAGAQGNFSLAMAEMGYDVTWNDLRADLIDYVKSKHERGHISFSPGNAFELEFPSLFDAVLITEVIEHVAHPDEFLISVAGLVKPGGVIVMTTPNGHYFRNGLPSFSDCVDPSRFEAIQFGPNAEDHIFLLHQAEVERFAKTADLQIDRVLMFNNPLTSGHVKLGSILPLLPKAIVSALERLTRWMPGHSKISAQMAVRFRKPS